MRNKSSGNNISIALVVGNADNLWYNLTTLFHVHIISYMQIKLFYKIFVIQCCTSYRSTRYLNFIKTCYRSNLSSTPNLIFYINKLCTCTFSLKFICDCPSRTFCCISQQSLLSERIYFQYNTVRCNRQILAFNIPIFYIIIYFIQRTHFAHSVTNLKPPLCRFLHIFILAITWNIIPKQIIKITVKMAARN